MKQRIHSIPSSRKPRVNSEALAIAISALPDAAAVRRFLDDLCTPAELEALVDRWRVVPFIIDGLPYRDIQEQTGVSVTTIGRVARTLSNGAGGYHDALEACGVTTQHSKFNQGIAS